jgi:hypothetical protein
MAPTQWENRTTQTGVRNQSTWHRYHLSLYLAGNELQYHPCLGFATNDSDPPVIAAYSPHKNSFSLRGTPYCPEANLKKSLGPGRRTFFLVDQASTDRRTGSRVISRCGCLIESIPGGVMDPLHIYTAVSPAIMQCQGSSYQHHEILAPTARAGGALRIERRRTHCRACI